MEAEPVSAMGAAHLMERLRTQTRLQALLGVRIYLGIQTEAKVQQVMTPATRLDTCKELHDLDRDRAH